MANIDVGALGLGHISAEDAKCGDGGIEGDPDGAFAIIFRGDQTGNGGPVKSFEPGKGSLSLPL